jgi:hypothetical protein
MIIAIRRLEMGNKALTSTVAGAALLASISVTATRAHAGIGDDLIEKMFENAFEEIIKACIETGCPSNPGAAMGSWRVTGLGSGQQLNMFSRPSLNTAIVGAIPAGGGGIFILDSFSRGRRWNGPADGQPEWCRVRYGAQEGWVSFEYLIRER